MGRQKRNYLRARGEYPSTCFFRCSLNELPPRTRRIRPPTRPRHPGIGTTSAHAENTKCVKSLRAPCRNYLRARGEYCAPPVVPALAWELPPRTRRIQRLKERSMALVGTTSAHAENTGTQRHQSPAPRNYLRARGEYPPPQPPDQCKKELPPRTRRIPMIGAFALVAGGTTSAHAENTFHKPCGEVAGGNYLRARGEYRVLGPKGRLA